MSRWKIANLSIHVSSDGSNVVFENVSSKER